MAIGHFTNYFMCFRCMALLPGVLLNKQQKILWKPMKIWTVNFGLALARFTDWFIETGLLGRAAMPAKRIAQSVPLMTLI